MPTKPSILTAITITALCHASPACAASTPVDADDRPGHDTVEPEQLPLIDDETFPPVALGVGDIHQLSGIAYLGGDDYFLVSDKGALVTTASIEIDRETGQITGAAIDDTIHIQHGKDLEDITLDLADGTLLVCDEASQTISRHRIGDGKRTEQYRVPEPMRQPRPNLGLESLALDTETGDLWFANEEALPGDSARATAEQGTLVRLQSMSGTGKPKKTFFYRTDPHTGADNLLKRAQCGVVALVPLPGGRMIVMERTLGGSAIPAFRNRLYLVSTQSGETLDGTPGLLDKRMLFQVDAGLANYEGLTLGPKLNDGDYALVLVSDDGGGKGYNPQSLLSLRLPEEVYLADSEEPILD